MSRGFRTEDRGARDKQYAQLDLHFHFETLKALRVSLDGDDTKDVWIPKSLCAAYEISADKKSVVVTVEEWFAKKEKLI